MNMRLVSYVGLLVVAGCSVLANPGSPERSFNEKADIKQLESQFGEGNGITKFYAGSQTSEARNQFITGRLALIDLRYFDFVRKFSVTKSHLDTGEDILAAGVGLATTAVGGEAAKSALGAASAGLSATRTSIDKNFFYEKTVPVLVTAMNAQRKVVLVPILQGMRNDLVGYPLAQAVTDLEAYYFAGTFLGALQSIQKDSAAKEDQADKQIDIVRSPKAQFWVGSKEGRAKVKTMLEKIDALPDARAIALQNNPPVPNATADKVKATTGSVARQLLKFRVSGIVDPDVEVPKLESALNQ